MGCGASCDLKPKSACSCTLRKLPRVAPESAPIQPDRVTRDRHVNKLKRFLAKVHKYPKLGLAYSV